MPTYIVFGSPEDAAGFDAETPSRPLKIGAERELLGRFPGHTDVNLPQEEAYNALQSGFIDAYATSSPAVLRELSDYENAFIVDPATGGLRAVGSDDGGGPQDFSSTSANETFEGGEGEDTVVFSGQRSDYALSRDASGAITVQGGPDGIDTLFDIERLQFADTIYDTQVGAKAASIPESELNQLVDLYVAYFNRVPEASGLTYWIDQLAGGKSLEAIADEFYAAGVQYSEVTGYSADQPLEDFVVTLYANVLSRSGAMAPSGQEISYWLNEVSSGAVSREGLVQRFLHDARQFYDDPEVGYVPELLDSKVAFGKLHAITFGLDYLDPQDAIERTVELADAVTAEGIDVAVALVGLNAENYL